MNFEVMLFLSWKNKGLARLIKTTLKGWQKYKNHPYGEYITHWNARKSLMDR